MREQIFLQNAAHVSAQNCDPKGPWTAAVNQFADWTPEEMRSLYGYKRKSWGATGATSLTSLSLSSDSPSLMPRMDIEIPETMKHDCAALHRHEDQGSCGSCWAFAAETVMRSRAELKNRSADFSVGQIVSCTPNPMECGGKGACDGATAELAYDYILQAGTTTDKKFPYRGHAGSCPKNLRAQKVDGVEIVVNEEGGEEHRIRQGAASMKGSDIGMIGWSKLPENKEMPIVRALVQDGPVAAAVAAGQDWSFYEKGVLTKEGCDQGHVINHAVTLFGFGFAVHPSLGKVKYWRIKNSWGRQWGEEGTLRLERLEKEEEYCGWDNQPEVGSGCKGGPSRVWVCGSCGILYDTVAPHFVAR